MYKLQTTLLEEKVADLKAEGNSETTATRLQQLAHSTASASSHKRDVQTSANHVAGLKLLLQSKLYVTCYHCDAQG